MVKTIERLDFSKRCTIISDKDIYKIIGEETNKITEVSKYRQLFDKGSETCEMVQNYPIHIDFELNYKCKFCYMSLSNKSDYGDNKKVLSFSKFKEIIDEGVKHGLCSIGLNGINEPLTVSNIENYIRYAKIKGILDISLNTNGSLLNFSKSAKLIAAGLTKIMISIDAFDEETYKIQRINGNYKLLMNNIKDFLRIKTYYQVKLPLLRVSFIENELNTNQLKPFKDFWSSKADMIGIQKLCDVFVNDADKSDNFRDYFKIDKSNKGRFFKCCQPFIKCMIRHNGDVIPCCSMNGLKNIVGNVNSSSLYDIWNGYFFNSFRKIVNNEKSQPVSCSNCRKSMIY